MRIYFFRIIIALLLVFSLPMFAQEPDDVRPIQDILTEAMAIKSSDFEKSALLFYQLRERQSELSKADQLELVYLEAYLQMMRGYYASAIETHSNLTKLKNPDLALRAYANMLAIDVLNRDFLSASKHLTPLLEILNSDRSKLKGEYINVGLTTVGHFYLHLGDAKNALLYLNQLDFPTLSSREQCLSQVKITRAKIALKQLPLTSPKIADTIDLCRSLQESFTQYSFIADIALIYISQEEYRLSLDLLTSELQNIDKLKFNRIKAEFFSYLATSFYHLNQLAEAKIYADKTLEVSEGIREKLPAKMAYEALYKIAINYQDEKNAYHFLNKLINAEEAYTKEEQFKALGLEQARQDLILLVDDLNSLDQQVKDEKNLVAFRKTNNRKFNLFIGIERLIHVVLLVVVLYQFRSVFIAIKETRQERGKLVYDRHTKAMLRAPFFKNAKQQLQDAENQNIPVTLIIFDLDNFRQINEFQGSDKADWVINNTIDKCIEISPVEVLLGRLGGDEFALLLPNYTLHQALHLCEQYKEAIADLDTKQISYKFNTTASFGVTDNTISPYQLEQMLVDADAALQHAKKLGGNAIQSFNSYIIAS